MTTKDNRQKKKENNALFPDYPRNTPIAEANGRMHSRWEMALSNIFQGLQKNFRPEGIVIPKLDTEDLNQIEASYQKYINKTLPVGIEDISGQMVFDKTTRLPKIFVITYNTGSNTVSAASWKTFTIT